MYKDVEESIKMQKKVLRCRRKYKDIEESIKIYKNV